MCSWSTIFKVRNNIAQNTKKMILYRFMSREELRRLQDGQTVVNESRHKGFKTEARGFCFTPDDPKEAIHWLSGNIDTEVCVTFDVPEGMMRKVRATYRDTSRDLPMALPMNSKDVAVIQRTEYCCTRYSLKQVRIVAVSSEFSGVPGIKETQYLLRTLGYRRAAR